MPFGFGLGWTQGIVLDGAQIPHEKGQLLGERTCPGYPTTQAQVHLYSPGCATVPSWAAYWPNLVNTIELSVCGGDAALC